VSSRIASDSGLIRQIAYAFRLALEMMVSSSGGMDMESGKG